MEPTVTIEEDYKTLREDCGIVDLSSEDRLELTGKDRQRFLNAYTTCDIKALAPGSGAYGFFTSPQGRILSDVTVLALEDRLWLELPPGQAGPLSDHLRKFILADRVEIRPLQDAVPLAIAGPRAEEVLGLLDGVEVTVQRRERMGVPAFTLWTRTPDILAERLAAAGARPVGTEALEILRVEAGVPRFGQDYGPDNFPQETGIEEAVSFTKGCYLGQEVVARIHYRGGVQKGLRGLVFDGEAPAAGAKILHDGRESGAATTVVRSIALGRTVGLGILHKRAGEPGTRVEVEGGGTAEVRGLPLVSRTAG